jgi:hypothetical protein
MMYKNVGRVYVETEGLDGICRCSGVLRTGRTSDISKDISIRSAIWHSLYAGFDYPFTYAPPFFYLASILYSSILYPSVLSCVLYSHL